MLTKEIVSITNSNIVFAKFMGAEHWVDMEAIQLYKFPDESVVHIGNLNYHSSWEMLMQVIEKIEEIGSYYIMARKQYNPIEFSRYGFKLYFNRDSEALLHLELKSWLREDTFRHPMYRDHIIKAFPAGSTKQEIVYSGLLEFINWYNAQK